MSLHVPPEGRRDSGAIQQASLDLATVGRYLYNQLLPTHDPTGADVRHWLEDLTRSEKVASLEIVCDGEPWFAPWNLVYDEDPDDGRFENSSAGLDKQFGPFWGIRHTLCGSLPVSPLRRNPLPASPDMLLIVDPVVLRDLQDLDECSGTEHRKAFEAFVEQARKSGSSVRLADSRRTLKQALKASRPDVMYWLCHADPEKLALGDDDIRLKDLDNLLNEVRVGKTGMGLVILNACRTAESGTIGSFLKCFHDRGYCGIIATEERTLDSFANPFGLGLLKGILGREGTIASMAAALRRKSLPLGLLYGAYCPPSLHVSRHEDGAAQAALETVSPAGAREAIVLGRQPERARGPSHRAPWSEPRLAGPPCPKARLTCHSASMASDTGLSSPVAMKTSSDLPCCSTTPRRESSFCTGKAASASHRSCGPGSSRIWKTSASATACFATGRAATTTTALRFCSCGRPTTRSGSSPRPSAPSAGSRTGIPLPTKVRSRSTWPPGLGRRSAPSLLQSAPPLSTSARALASDPDRLGEVLAAVAAELPFTLVVVVDQAEEMFTLAVHEEQVARRDLFLESVRRIACAAGPVKLIISLRTEFYGRLIDRLRRGVAGATGVREYLLTDLDREGLIEAICRPTLTHAIRYTDQIPAQVYKFRYAPGVPEAIASELMRAGQRDGVLPLVQFLCDQLYRRACEREDSTVSHDDFEQIGRLRGGLRRHLEQQLERLAPGRPVDQNAFKELLARLTHRQADGTLTTELLREDQLAPHWRGSTPCSTILTDAEALRLIRFSTRRLDDGTPERLISLGHDALARIADTWREESQRRLRFRRLFAVAAAASVVAACMAVLAVFALVEKRKADKNSQAAIREIRAKYEAETAQNRIRLHSKIRDLLVERPVGDKAQIQSQLDQISTLDRRARHARPG